MLYILKYQNTSEYTTKTNFLVLFFEPAMSNALLVIVFNVILMVRLGFWGWWLQREMVLYYHIVTGVLLSTWLMTIDIDLDHLAEVVIVKFLPFHTIIFGGKSLHAAHSWGVEGYVPLLEGGIYVSIY